MATNTPYINFSLTWLIKWSEFRELSRQDIEKSFSTAFNSVVFHWSVKMGTGYQGTDPAQFGLYLYYNDGPSATVEKMNFKMAFMKPDSPNVKTKALCFSDRSGPIREWDTLDRGYGKGWCNFDTRNIDEFQKKYGFTSEQPLLCQITLQIPTAAFSFTYPNPLTVISAQQWMIDLFKDIEDAGKAEFSNAKLVASDGHVFYCDKVVLARQSPEMAKMFTFPRANGQPENTYPFPTMSSGSLRAVLEFLYTGQINLGSLSTVAIIKVADAAEQYRLEKLKEACRAELWVQLVTKDIPVEDHARIICFADLHDDFRYIKQRSMEILAGELGKAEITVESVFLILNFLGNGERGDRLAKEFTSYGIGRVEGYFMI